MFFLLVSLGGGVGHAAAPPPMVGGNTTSSMTWPSVVGVVAESSTCTGVLIGASTVLTAASCGEPTGVLVGADDLVSAQGTRFEVDSVTRHPDYQGFGYDMALVRLSTPVTDVEPTPPSLDCMSRSFDDGMAAVAVGYGATQTDGSGNNSALHEVTLLIDDADCSEDSACDSLASGVEFFSGGDGRGLCFGDGGAPLFVLRPGGWVLAGLGSRPGSGAQQGDTCGVGDVYSRPDAVMSWILSLAPQVEPVLCVPGPTVTVEPFGEVGNKGTYRTSFSVELADGATEFEVSIAVPPELGSAAVDGNELSFTGDGDSVGSDSLTLEVTDDRGGATFTDVPFQVVDGRVGCGCRTSSPSVSWLALLGLLGLRRKR